MPFSHALLTHDADGATVECWRGQRKLTIDMSTDGHVEYTRVWGPDILSDMDDGDVTSAARCGDLWSWLMEDLDA